MSEERTELSPIDNNVEYKNNVLVTCNIKSKDTCTTLPDYPSGNDLDNHPENDSTLCFADSLEQSNMSSSSGKCGLNDELSNNTHDSHILKTTNTDEDNTQSQYSEYSDSNDKPIDEQGIEHHCVESHINSSESNIGSYVVGNDYHGDIDTQDHIGVGNDVTDHDNSEVIIGVDPIEHDNVDLVNDHRTSENTKEDSLRSDSSLRSGEQKQQVSENWICLGCGKTNFKNREVCFSRDCRTMRNSSVPPVKGGDRDRDYRDTKGSQFSTATSQNSYNLPKRKEGDKNIPVWRTLTERIVNNALNYGDVGDWICSLCDNHNYARRSLCKECQKGRKDLESERAYMDLRTQFAHLIKRDARSNRHAKYLSKYPQGAGTGAGYPPTYPPSYPPASGHRHDSLAYRGGYRDGYPGYGVGHDEYGRNYKERARPRAPRDYRDPASHYPPGHPGHGADDWYPGPYSRDPGPHYSEPSRPYPYDRHEAQRETQRDYSGSVGSSGYRNYHSYNSGPGSRDNHSHHSQHPADSGSRRPGPSAYNHYPGDASEKRGEGYSYSTGYSSQYGYTADYSGNGPSNASSNAPSYRANHNDSEGYRPYDSNRPYDSYTNPPEAGSQSHSVSGPYRGGQYDNQSYDNQPFPNSTYNQSYNPNNSNDAPGSYPPENAGRYGPGPSRF